ncbi:MAG TPA: PQQ-dependent sugar dehydrogenase [Geminicoccaceae bacterium]|nr:PQQ-dependent sugar dehydrogenase [Geminicoccaceae bacterium]
MRLARFCTTCLLSAAVSMFASCGSWHMSSSLGAGELPSNVASEEASFSVERVTGGLEHPWGMAFLPDGRILVTERPGRLRLIEADGTLDPTPLEAVPTAFARGQGGLLDVALHPGFNANRLVYLSFSQLGGRGAVTAVARGTLEENGLAGTEVIFTSNGQTSHTRHFGSRLAFDTDGRLWVTHGDRGERDLAQDLKSHAGSVLRLTDDGGAPEDNPFVGQRGAMPEIYSMGHRNPQGLAIHPATGAIWIHEHGPRGGDEINILEAGGNYGWPVVSQGREYASGRAVGASEAAGMTPAIYIWDPSIAPSGMAFYDGEAFPEWRGDLFVGALAYQLLARLELDGDRVVHEERLLEDELGRIRDVAVGPNGFLYLLTDEADGGLFRLVPALQP